MLRTGAPSHRRATIALVAALGFVVAGCGGAAGPSRSTSSGAAAPGGSIVPPEAGLSPSEAAAVALLRTRLEPVGFLLSPVSKPVRPAEPTSLSSVSRAVYRVELADPDQGYVIVYDFASDLEAAAGGRQLAAFLGSGFGQTMYAVDAQFSVGQLGSAVIFTWWSAQRSGDAAKAGAAFQLVAGAGQTIPVVR